MSNPLASLLIFPLCLVGAILLLILSIRQLISSIHGKSLRIHLRILDAMGEAHLTRTQNESFFLLKRSAYAEKDALRNVLASWKWSASILNLMHQAGLGWTVATFLRLSLISALAFFVCCFYWTRALGLACVLSGLGTSVPLLYLHYRQGVRGAQLERQLPEILDWIARALRAGHSLNMALTMASQDASDPFGHELKLAVEALRYGQSMEDCLQQLARTLPGTDMQYVVLAILVQRETGGNLADLLTRVANTIRSRLMLKNQIKAQSAEGKLSAWILTALPMLLLTWNYCAVPGAMQILIVDPLGQKVLMGALTALLLGTVWVWRISSIPH